MAPYYGMGYDTLRLALYRLAENGKKLTIQHDADYFADVDSVMHPMVILTDATPGVVYNKVSLSKTKLWISFDYGKNWILREENSGSKKYYSSNFEGLIHRGGGI